MYCSLFVPYSIIILPANPCDATHEKDVTTKTVFFFTALQVDKLFSALSPEWRIQKVRQLSGKVLKHVQVMHFQYP